MRGKKIREAEAKAETRDTEANGGGGGGGYRIFLKERRGTEANPTIYASPLYVYTIEERHGAEAERQRAGAGLRGKGKPEKGKGRLSRDVLEAEAKA